MKTKDTIEEELWKLQANLSALRDKLEDLYCKDNLIREQIEEKESLQKSIALHKQKIKLLNWVLE